MRRKFIIVFILSVSANLYAGIYPQTGAETYIGKNKLFVFTPWVGLRIGLSNSASLIFKYYNHNIRFNYLNDEGNDTKRIAHLSNFTTVIYAQKNQHDFYSAFSYFVGTDSYRAFALDSGAAIRVSDRIKLEMGTYILKENSILWYPNEKSRNISLYSLKGGIGFRVFKWFSINPKIYLYSNSEDVKASTYSLGFIFIPKSPIYITLYYFKYSESAQYRFSGDYISVGLNFYY